MKKGVIIAIFIVYLASIVLVQIFGIPVSLPDSGAYIDGITVDGVELSNPQDGQNLEIRSQQQEDGSMLYLFRFVEGEYTKDEESLQNNPNRIKINYTLTPEDASKSYLDYIYEESDDYCVLQETDEIVFLRKGARIALTMQESRANLNIRVKLIIYAR